MSLTLFAENLESIPSVAKQILEYASPHKKFVFSGKIGVGKTTLIKALSLQLGVSDVVSSPTFSIVNEYHADDKTIVYHFDFYRIKNEEEAMDIGIDEYFYSNNLCLIEWPNKVENLLPLESVKVIITENNESNRTIELINNE